MTTIKNFSESQDIKKNYQTNKEINDRSINFSCFFLSCVFNYKFVRIREQNVAKSKNRVKQNERIQFINKGIISAITCCPNKCAKKIQITHATIFPFLWVFNCLMFINQYYQWYQKEINFIESF